MTRFCCTFVTRPKKRTNCQKKKAGWLLTISCLTGGGDGKKYGWFGREEQREDNVVKGLCCLEGLRVYILVDGEETRKHSQEIRKNLPGDNTVTCCLFCVIFCVGRNRDHKFSLGCCSR